MTPSATAFVFALSAFLLELVVAHPTKAQQEAECTWTDKDGKTHTRAQLETILREHEAWVDSHGKSGKKADLKGARA